MTMQTIPAKTILARRAHPDTWFGCSYNMNIYKGCSHGCIYCDSRSECYGVEDFHEVRAKENALAIIEQELKTKRIKDVVGTGAMSDPYNPHEEKERLTRGALELLLKYRYGVCLCTKSSLVARDIDLYREIAKHAPVCVKLTVTAFDDALCKKIEPCVAKTSERFEAIRLLKQAGIYTGILLMPVLPFICDTQENVAAIVREAAKCGADFIYPAFGVTLRQNQRDYFYRQLDRSFPGMKQKYIEAFGNTYECVSPRAKSLWKLFAGLCGKYGIRYDMGGIIAGYKKPKTNQISLF